MILKNSVHIFFYLLITIFTLSMSTQCVLAQTAGTGGQTAGTVSLENPLTGTSDEPNINLIIGKAINGVLGVVGSIALVMVIYGGLTWMLAAGNQQRVQKGKDILIWAVVGLVVIFSAYALVRFLLINVFGATPETTSLLQLFRLV